MDWFDNWFCEDDMRDENEKRIFKTIRENDVETLKEILKDPVDCRLGSKDTPILSIAVLKGGCAMISHLINSGCDPRKVDKNAFTTLNILLWGPPRSAEDEKRRLDIVDIFLATYSNPVEIVFLDADDEYKLTPFLDVCAFGYDAIILRFLDLLENNSISMNHVINSDGDNLFHLLLSGCLNSFPPTRLETVRTLINKFSYSDQLIDAKNVRGETPLHQLICSRYAVSFMKQYSREVAALANIFFQYGACPNTLNRYHWTYLECAVVDENVWLIEVLLRAGCHTSIFGIESPLANILKKQWENQLESIRAIEFLLAFGYDLQNDLYLYTADERPIEFASPDHADLRDTSKMNLPILEALRELRRSNKMFSLQRQCRNTIRRHLESKADEVIGKLDCIPDRIKSFLLVENEQPMLELAE